MSTAMVVSLILAVLVLLLAAAAAVTAARRNCSDTCGGYGAIPYPFGIGHSCSLPGFSLTCAGNRLLLGNSSMEVGVPLGASYQSLDASISYSIKMIPGVRDYSVHWETPARPFAISSSTGMSLFVVGCGVKASMFIGNSSFEVGSCSLVCAGARVMEKLPVGTCDRMGCCRIDIHVNLRAFTLNITRISDSARSKKLNDGTLVTDISIDDGVLHVQEINKATGIDLLADSDPALYALSAEWGTVTWAVENTTCEDAKLDKGDYRCFTSHSDCVDVTQDRTTEHSGYRCKCTSGFEGNPYMRDGCTDINECLLPHKYICNGICQNSVGSYACASCPHGSDFNIVTRKCKPSTILLVVTIGLSSGGGILVLAVIVAILTRRWKRSVQKRLRRRHFRKNRGILLEQLISSDKSASDGTKMFSLEELQKATNNFDHSRVVGRGGHGTVYKGILTDQRVVAIKKSTLAVMSEIDEFINEVSILSQINHRNVVKLHGCCLESEVPLLVYEFVSNGTLYDLLHRQQELPLPWEERLRIATEIAGALTYLHSAASVSILHRDVKCMNVLLNDSYTAKVSDFGASRLIPIDQTHLVTAVQGTFGYLDPEYYHTGQLNEKSDVYSFGVILVELLTRRKPIIENEHGEKQNLSNYFLWAMRERPLEETVDAQILEEGTEEGVMCMARLAEECLSLTRVERPAMKDVVMRLQLITGRRAAPRARPRCEAPEDFGRGGVVSVVGQHGSRQYSQEQEFVSSLRVPR
ncbi:unnamed protein product [Alopecurus aequalis]